LSNQLKYGKFLVNDKGGIHLKSNKKQNKVNCFRCKYYATTWEPKFPRACRLYGFKTARIPSAEVYRNTGEHCNGFEEKRR